ncbi:hypothetical protein HBH69_167280 [Parastagonospora nodorum]|nr:hypothetical protein HBH43_229340 [Parastagonospora nodorum]KAH5147750.1 hypothetical protein HBH69_167280 [Parastagonospora nodorum]KAH5344596.1 hypothetical protein HBI49_221430 [Parastagonospora nodorum]KAH6391018.1 hypothetical protein HBI60_168850 [Parastagonospora nodorum]
MSNHVSLSSFRKLHIKEGLNVGLSWQVDSSQRAQSSAETVTKPKSLAAGSLNMRLIKINKGKAEGPKLEDFTYSVDKPPYMIFSHRWLQADGGDVTFEEFQSSSSELKQAFKKKGRKEREAKLNELGLRVVAFYKLLQAIEIASIAGAEYIWIDSCCINRANSSELTEALNSMYRYYEKATKCLVYLHDVEWSRTADGEKQPVRSYDFSKPEWFTRGWTLQELIAPKQVSFYNKDWKYFGELAEHAKAIEEVTNVPEMVLKGDIKPNKCSVAQRMSWAANRNTTRDEDMSYSLFGLFDVNLVPMYGEGGTKAFIRLQEAIMSRTNDMSLFAWQSTDNEEEYRGVLARSPKEFGRAGELIDKRILGSNPEFSMTNRGLKIMPLLAKKRDGTLFLPLNCTKTGENSVQSLGIILRKQRENDTELCRYKPGVLFPFDWAIFMDEYAFWLKQSETPIYIVRDERYRKHTSRGSSPPTVSRRREQRGISTSRRAAHNSERVRRPSPSDNTVQSGLRRRGNEEG